MCVCVCVCVCVCEGDCGRADGRRAGGLGRGHGHQSRRPRRWELGELLLHGYDIASVVGAPWPIQPGSRRPRSVGIRAALSDDRQSGTGPGTERRRAGRTEGRWRHDSPVRRRRVLARTSQSAGPVECTVSADPVAFLMVVSRRLTRWAAITLGRSRGKTAENPGFAGHSAAVLQAQDDRQPARAGLQSQPPSEVAAARRSSIACGSPTSRTSPSKELPLPTWLWCSISARGASSAGAWPSR